MGVKLGTDNNWAIKDGNLLAYNDASGRFFNKEFDFARGSRATYVGRDGLIKNSGEQPTNLVQNGDFSQLGSELVVNGDFATDSNWTKGTGWSIANGKATSAGSNFGGQLKQTILETNKIYLLTFDIVNYTSGVLSLESSYYGETQLFSGIGSYTAYFNSSSQTELRLYSQNFNGSIDNVSVKQVDPNDEWSLASNWTIGDSKAIADGTSQGALTQTIAAPIVGNQYKIQFTISDYSIGNLRVYYGGVFTPFVTANGVYVSYITAASTDATFQTSIATPFNGSITNISVQEIDTNTPRIDFTDDVNGHLLLEPQRTNLYAYSEDFSNAAWTKSAATVVITSNVAPDGTTNSVYNLTGTNANLYTGGTAGVEYTVSVYAKSNGQGKDNFKLRLGNSTSSSITVTDEWVRYQFTATPTTTVFGLTVDGSPNNQWDILIWGAQLEQASYATSYIPTYGSAQTRLGETCNNSGSAQDFNSEEGVLYAEIKGLVAEDIDRAISLNDGSFANSVIINYHSSSGFVFFQVYKTSVRILNFNVNNVDKSISHKIAFKYKNADYSVWIDGVEVLTNTLADNIPANTLSKLNFDRGDGGSDFYGKTKALAVYNTALTDAELQALTTI
jgi:hypothetical protein